MQQDSAHIPSDYTVAWICALPLEMTAAIAMLDKSHPRLVQEASDNNVYTLGECSGHNVVITCLPSGVYGTTAAATVAAQLLHSFPAIQFGLMVGIGGGVPSPHADIRLGDVVVSVPTGTCSGVIQYDYGKTVESGRFHRTGSLNKPPQSLLSAVSHVRSRAIQGKTRISPRVRDTLDQHPEMQDTFAHPGEGHDRLFLPDYEHSEVEPSCDKCSTDREVARDKRISHEPQTHYGIIASGNKVIKHARTRDRLSQELGVLCFEMEAAGLMDQMPCLVIRGICDYSDSHKNKRWQGYAALTAAAYAKEILSVIGVPKENFKRNDTNQMTLEENACLGDLFLTDPREDMLALKRRKGARAAGTCQWILQTEKLRSWLGLLDEDEAHDSSVLWLHGLPGTGKSTIAMTLAEELPHTASFASGQKTFAYFFCDSSSENHRTAIAILRGLLYQLIKQHPSLFRYFKSKYTERKNSLLLSFDALWAVLVDMISDTSTGEKYIMIDALDECDQDSQSLLLKQFNMTFNQTETPAINILIISRPYIEIEEELGCFSNQNMSSFEDSKSDIEIFISAKIMELRKKKRYTDETSRTILSILLDKAEGTFLWVGIASDELSRVPSKQAVQILQELPTGLRSLYRKLLEDAVHQSGSSQETIKKILYLVAVARRPLSLLELSSACKLYQDFKKEERIQFIREEVALCRLMVVIHGETVFLLHKSVKDFLMNVNEGYILNEKTVHAALAYRGIEYIVQNLIPPGVESLQDPFLRYSTEYWAEHAHLAGSGFRIDPRHHEFFQVDFESREAWLEYHRIHVKAYRPIARKFSIFHVAAKWGLITVIDHVLPEDSDSLGMESFSDVNFANSDNVTPLEESARAGHADIFAALLRRGGHKMEIREMVLVAAAANELDARKMWDDILKQYKTSIHITDRVLKTVVRNTKFGMELLALLIQEKRDTITITEEVLSEAAQYSKNGREILPMLLDQLGPQIQIAEEVMLAAGYNHWTKDIFLDLLKQQRGKFRLSLGILCHICSTYNSQTIETLLEGQWEAVENVDSILCIAAVNSKEVLIMLTERLGDRAKLNTRHLEFAARNSENGMEIVTWLLGRPGTDMEVTHDVLEAAVGNPSMNREFLELLLQQRKEGVEITERLLLSSIRRSWGTLNTLIPRILLEYMRPDCRLHDESVIQILSYCDEETVELLLQLRGAQIDVTDERLMMAAAGNPLHPEVVHKLSELRGYEIPMTEHILIAAVESGSLAHIQGWFAKARGQVKVTEALLQVAATRSPEIIEFILNKAGEDVEITEGVVIAAASAFELLCLNLPFLLSRMKSSFRITENIVKAALSHPMDSRGALLALFDRQYNIEITDEIMMIAVCNVKCGKPVIELLLDRVGNQIHITMEMVNAIAQLYDQLEYSWDRQSVVETIHFLGNVCESRGNQLEADILFQKEVGSCNQAWGEEHTRTLNAIHNLGAFHMRQGKLAEAERTLHEAMVKKSEVLGADNVSTLRTIHLLGQLYYCQERLLEASEMYLRALSGYEKTLGRNHIHTSDILLDCSHLLENTGDLEMAERMAYEALISYGNIVGAEDIRFMNTLHGIGNLQQKAGKINDAESTFQEVLAAYEMALGRNHASTWYSVCSLADAYLQGNKLKEAEAAYQRALLDAEIIFGANDSRVFLILPSLAIISDLQGDSMQAVTLLQQAWNGLSAVLGPDNPVALSVAESLETIMKRDDRSTMSGIESQEFESIDP